jgi:hypothetical protein
MTIAEIFHMKALLSSKYRYVTLDATHQEKCYTNLLTMSQTL